MSGLPYLHVVVPVVRRFSTGSGVVTLPGKSATALNAPVAEPGAVSPFLVRPCSPIGWQGRFRELKFWINPDGEWELWGDDPAEFDGHQI